MCRLRNIAMCDYQESVTTGQTDRQIPDKAIPMCRYASQATQKRHQNFDLSTIADRLRTVSWSHDSDSQPSH